MALTEEEIREAIEHRDVLLDIRAILATASGKNFFKYLFKALDVCELPEPGLDNDFLRDQLGFLRSGNAIFKLVSEANPEVAGFLLAQKEKDAHAKLYADAQTGEN